MRNMQKKELQIGKKVWENQIMEDIADSVKESWGWSAGLEEIIMVSAVWKELKEGTRKGLSSSKSDFKYYI